MEQQEQEAAVSELEEKVDRLRVLYEQYFLGFEKLEPLIARKDVDRRFALLRREQLRNTGTRFRYQVVTQKYNTYSMYWHRICRQIEEGTFKRHAQRAQRILESDDAAPKPRRRGKAAAEAEAEAAAAEAAAAEAAAAEAAAAEAAAAEAAAAQVSLVAASGPSTRFVSTRPQREVIEDTSLLGLAAAVTRSRAMAPAATGVRPRIMRKAAADGEVSAPPASEPKLPAEQSDKTERDAGTARRWAAAPASAPRIVARPPSAEGERPPPPSSAVLETALPATPAMSPTGTQGSREYRPANMAPAATGAAARPLLRRPSGAHAAIGGGGAGASGSAGTPETAPGAARSSPGAQPPARPATPATAARPPGPPPSTPNVARPPQGPNAAEPAPAAQRPPGAPPAIRPAIRMTAPADVTGGPPGAAPAVAARPPGPQVRPAQAPNAAKPPLVRPKPGLAPALPSDARRSTPKEPHDD